MHLTIVLPVYKDWQSLQQLVREISALNVRLPLSLHLLIVNDGDLNGMPSSFQLPNSIDITVINLLNQQGHQRALICGLCHLYETELPADHRIIVMDADGEDRAQDVETLLNASLMIEEPVFIFARRDKRSEGLRFRFSYWSYRLMFSIMTGQQIQFGNFSCLPAALLPQVVHHPDAWNHYAGAILKSGLPLLAVSTERGKRYFGNSKITFNRLVLHGLSALSIYMDLILVRFLKMAFLTFLLFFGALGGLVYIKFATKLAIPGWTSFLFSNILGMMLTLTGFTFLVVLQQLQNRSRKQDQPIRFYKDYIGSIKHLSHV
jgi:hypothetical protein